jgi:adenylate cyclase
MPDRQSRRLAAILAADISGYSALMGADEVRTVRDLKGHRAVVLPMIAEYAGRVIDTAGDGILAEFASVTDAVECAVSIQRVMADRNAEVESGRQMKFRIGINLGDVIYDDTTIFGDGVNIAARLESIAEPGGITISDEVFRQIQGKVGVAFENMGEHQLKNINRPIRVYRAQLGKTVLEPELASGPPKNPQNTGGERPALPLPDKPSLAVLPFVNMSNDPEQEYFVDGITEDIITALSKWRWFFVIARNSTFTYKGRAVEIREVGRELGVRYILEGSVRKVGNRLRLNAQLVDTLTGAHVWAERFDREFVDVFAVQDELTQHVTAAIGPAVTKVEAELAKRKTPEQLVAWDHYLRGMWHFHQISQNDLTQSIASFAHAIALDPSLAEAHAGIARAAMAETMYYGSDRRANISKATAAARKSLAADDQNVEACYALAIAASHDDNLDSALELAQRATRLNENFAPGHFALAIASLYSGKPQASLDAVDLALRLNPTDPQRFTWLSLRASALYLLNRYEDAAACARQSLSLNRYHTALRVLAAATAQLGHIDDAKAAMRELLTSDYGDKNISDVVKPFKSSTDRAKYQEGLAKAGMPDG